MKLYGIDFADDEVQALVVNGEPTWFINEQGLRRACGLIGLDEAATQRVINDMLHDADTLFLDEDGAR